MYGQQQNFGMNQQPQFPGANFPPQMMMPQMPQPQMQYKPVGVFWDIENCPVPKGKLASAIIDFIRKFFIFNRLNHREYEFLVACDVTRTRKDVTEDINKAGGVTLAHVCGNAKNAADEKLRESMKRFVDTHASSIPTLVLISGDIDFVNDLRAYQARLGCNVILLHGLSCSQQFKMGWNEIYPFETFLVMMGGQIGAGSSVTEGNKIQGPAKSRGGNANNKEKKDKTQTPGPGPKQQGQGSGPKQQGQGSGPKQQGQGSGPKQQGQGPAKGPNINQGQQQGQGPNKGKGNNPNNAKENAGSGNNPKPGGKPTVNSQQNQNQQGPGKKNKNPSGENLASNMGQMQIEPKNVPSPNKPGASGPPPPEWILMVTGLPGKMDYQILKSHLQTAANEVGGKVKFVNNGQGFITFRKKEDADKAVLHFNGREVYGKKLNVTFTRSIPFPKPVAGAGAGENFTFVNKPAGDKQSAGTGSAATSPTSPTLAQAVGAFALGALKEMHDQQKKKRGQNNGPGSQKEMDPNCSIQ